MKIIVHSLEGVHDIIMDHEMREPVRLTGKIDRFSQEFLYEGPNDWEPWRATLDEQFNEGPFV